jgi:Rrf2 family transcriptional regulator, iron-sulfur cluster assembly transcription factor
MLQLTMTGEYAVRAMLHLASLPPGKTVQIADIAKEWDVPEVFLRKIITQLSRGGLVASFRGKGGGVALSREATTITLLDVIECIEGPLALNACLTNPLVCHRIPFCAVHSLWHEAQAKIREVFTSRSLADLAGHHAPGCRPTIAVDAGILTPTDPL